MLTNSQFLSELRAGTNAALWVAGFHGEPGTRSNWSGQPYDERARRDVDRWQDRNAYFSVAGLKPVGGQLKRRKANFARLLALVADDVELSALVGDVSWVLTTSPGKHQAGILLDPECGDCMDAALVDRLMKHMGQLGLTGFSDPSGNNACRYVRLPMGRNEKPRPTGPYPHQVERWNPAVRYSLADAAAVFGIDLDALRQEYTAPRSPAPHDHGQGNTIAEAAANIIHGEALHESVNRFTASCVAQGMPGGAVVNIARTLMQASEAPRDDRWQERFNDIPRAVTTAQEKYPPKAAIGPQDGAEAGAGIDASERESARLVDCVVSLADLPDHAEDYPHVVAHWLPMDEVTLMTGHGGGGKSLTALLLAVHVALGRPFAGLPVRQGPVLFFSGEDGGHVLRLRLARICRALDVNPDTLQGVLHLVDASDLDPALHRELRLHGGAVETETALVLELAAQVEQVGAVLVVIDNASDTYDDDELKRSRTRRFIRSLRNRLARPGRSVLLLAHVNKAAAAGQAKHDEDYSGNTAWHNSVRSRLSLSPEGEDGLRIDHRKANYGGRALPVSLRWRNGVPMVLDACDAAQGRAVAARMDREQAEQDNAATAALLALVRDFDSRGERIPAAATGPANGYKTLSRAAGFPDGVGSDRFWRLVRMMEAAGTIYRRTVRTPARRYVEVLTAVPEPASERTNADSEPPESMGEAQP